VSSIDQRTFGAKKQVLLSNTKKQKKLWSVLGKGNASSPQVFSNTKKPKKKKSQGVVGVKVINFSFFPSNTK